MLHMPLLSVSEYRINAVTVVDKLSIGLYLNLRGFKMLLLECCITGHKVIAVVVKDCRCQSCPL